MPSANAKIIVSPPPAYRGGAGGSPVQHLIQSARITHSWGSEPATAEVVYLGDDIQGGYFVTIQMVGYTFYGTANRFKPVISSQGNEKTLSFVDLRDYMDWDHVYCAFNKSELRLVGGIYARRYWHILPGNFNRLERTYTTSPLTAAQILNHLFNAATVEDNWSCNYHSDQINYPVYELDFLGGPKLREAVQEISDKQGLVFTLSGLFELSWVRKGEGIAPAIPAGSDFREDGAALSGHPTRIRVLGDRNRYQIHDIPMQRSWTQAWEQFYDLNLFIDDIYNRGSITAPFTIGGTTHPAGTAFTEIDSGDSEQIAGRQLAASRAMEITVWEYAELRGDHGSWDDYRRYAGRSRLDMPAALYIETILFRAFEPPSNFAIVNGYGQIIPGNSLSIVPEMIASVTHSPTTGYMNWYGEDPPSGNGYAVVRGYQVGKDLFRTIQPDRFKVSDWLRTQEVWEHHEFQIDDSGDGRVGYILFTEPVINSADLVVMKDGYAVLNANPTITVPQVRAALTFEAEIFSYIVGSGTRDDREIVSGLYSEFVGSHGYLPAELPFLDGQYATEKAQDYGGALLNNQFVYRIGSYVEYPAPNGSGVFPAGSPLTAHIDRIEIELSPSGWSVTKHLTSEQPRTTFVPERDLDRASRMRSLLPGQEQLRARANIHSLTAAAIAQDGAIKRTLTDAVRGPLGTSGRVRNTTILDNAGGSNLQAGTPLWRSKDETLPALPANTGATRKIFVGVTVRDGELVSGIIPHRDSGVVLTRVYGPVSENGVVGRSQGNDYLVSGGDVGVGVALKDVAAGMVKLIPVRIGASTGGNEPVWLP